MRGQSALETLVTVSALLVFSVPVVLLVLSASALRLEDLSVFQGQTSVQQLSDSINEVYLQGNGSSRSILVQLPSNTRNLTVSGNSLTLYLSTQNGVYALSHPLLANASEYIISRSGLVNMEISMEGNTVVIR
ncbi:MAG: hypothetical protein PHS02_00025 [Candidatus ainarchaeum sp.]|nr:hypothetical protein [Candidatus ainarchaeum sp.]